MTAERNRLRCAVYTRVSTDHGLEQEFNSLDAQRETAKAYIKSQAHEGWSLVRESFDDGGFSGGSLERPALQRLLEAMSSPTTSWRSTPAGIRRSWPSSCRRWWSSSST